MYTGLKGLQAGRKEQGDCCACAALPSNFYRSGCARLCSQMPFSVRSLEMGEINTRQCMDQSKTIVIFLLCAIFRFNLYLDLIAKYCILDILHLLFLSSKSKILYSNSVNSYSDNPISLFLKGLGVLSQEYGCWDPQQSAINSRSCWHIKIHGHAKLLKMKATICGHSSN